MPEELSIHVDHDKQKAVAIKSETRGSKMVVKVATIKPDDVQPLPAAPSQDAEK